MLLGRQRSLAGPKDFSKERSLFSGTDTNGQFNLLSWLVSSAATGTSLGNLGLFSPTVQLPETRLPAAETALSGGFVPWQGARDGDRPSPASSPALARLQG